MFTKKIRMISMIVTICMILSSMAVFCLPAAAEEEALNYAPVTNVGEGAEATLNDYRVSSLEDWMYLSDNADQFRKSNITIHLTTDIDLSGSLFKSFINPGFSIDGHGHTIRNWGTVDAPINTRAMFFANGKNGDAAVGMNFIKNLTLKNCHTTNGTTSSALLYTSDQDNAGYSTLPDDFTIDHVTFENCSMTATSSPECIALVIGRHTVSDRAATVNVTNVTVKNSKVVAGADHAAILIAKPRGNTSPMVYNINNCLLEGNTLKFTKTADKEGNGMLVGTAEASGSNTIVNISAVALLNNITDLTAKPVKSASLLGKTDSSIVTMKGVALSGHKAITTQVVEGETIVTEIKNDLYLLNMGTRTTVENIFCDSPLKAVATGNENLTLSTADPGTEMKAAAWAISKAAVGDTDFYWTVDNKGNLVKAVSKEQSMRRVDMRLRSNGTILQTKYAEGGTLVPLFIDGDDNAEFYLNGVRITDEFYLVPMDGKDLIFDVEVDELIIARNDLKAAIARYAGKELKYYAEGLTEKLAEAEAALKDSTATATELQALVNELDHWGYAAYPNLPLVTDMDLYPGVGGYIIKDAAGLEFVKANVGSFDTDQTLYLGADIDLKGSTFNGIQGLKASFDGQGHKIKNWGIAANGTVSAITSRGFLNSVYGGAAYIKSIKNLTFENCHTAVNADGTGSAMLYGIGHANGGMPAGSSTTLDISNIHFEGCSIKVNADVEVVAFVLGRYAITGSNANINISGCSVIGSTLDGSGTQKGHYAMLVGKPRSGNAGEVTTYKFTDCYVANNTLKTGKPDSTYMGLVFGTAEYQSGTKVEMKNIGVVGNTYETAAPQANLIGDIQNSNIKVDGLLVRDNIVSGGSSPKAVLFEGGSGLSLSNAYCSDTLNKLSTAGSAALTGTNVDAKAAYELNSISGGNLFWTTNAGKAEKGTLASATVKVDVQMATGGAIGSYYANGSITFDIPDVGSYALAEGSTGTIKGNTLTLAGDGKDVVVIAKLSEAAQKRISLEKLDGVLDYFDTLISKGAVLDAETAALVAEAKNMDMDDALSAIEKATQDLNALIESGAYAPATTMIDDYPNASAYSVWSKEDFLYLSAQHSRFNREGVVIYIGKNIDMTGATGFTTMSNSKVAIDGLGNEIQNWTHTFGSYGTAAIFSGNYQGGSIKNLTFRDCNFSGGYGRSVLFSEYTGGDLLIENIDMINVILNASTAENQMGLYISRTTTNSGNITIRNCKAQNCKLENSVNSYINNCGIIIGCIKGTYNTLLDGVDIIDCENNTETHSGGMAIGSFESSATLSFKDVGIFGGKINPDAGVPYASIFAGFACITPSVTFTDCISKGVNSTATKTWINTDTTQAAPGTIAATNCFSDFGSGVKAVNNGTGVEDSSKSRPDLTGVSAIGDVYEIAYQLDRYVSDAANTYLLLRQDEGYGKVYKIQMVDLYSGDEKLVDTFYTKASGKLPAEAASVLTDDLYDWKLDGVAVDAETVFTADSKVTSLAVHNFRDGVKVSVTGNTHEVTCADDGCNATIVEDCYASTYNPNVAGVNHTPVCGCGNALPSEPCSFEYSHVAGTQTHIGICEQCDESGAAQLCDFANVGTILPGDEPTTTGTGKMTYGCKAECGNARVEIIPQLAEATLKVVADSMVGLGDQFDVRLTFSGNANPGVSGLVAILTYDAQAMTIANPATDVVFNGFEGTIVSEAGMLKIAIAAGAPVTEDVAFATIKFTASADANKAGDYAIDVEVKNALVSGTAADDASTLDLTMRSEGATVALAQSVWGDVNRDGKVSMADVILILRVHAGTVAKAEIDQGAAQITEGDNLIDTADGVALLRYLMSK